MRLGCMPMLAKFATFCAEASIRPRHVRLGCKSREEAHSQHMQASMRQRRVRLAQLSRSIARTRMPLFDASMRPRRVRLGCYGRRRDSTPSNADIRFNEAEARAPRMPARRPPWAPMFGQEVPSMRPRRVRLGCGSNQGIQYLAFDGFNEAEARAPRMQLSNRAVPTSGRVASMRPRRVRLGCTEAIECRTRRACGARSFNEAEARAPRMRENYIDRNPGPAM